MNKLNLKFGKNFITSKNIIIQIINIMKINKNDNFIEIGFGKGHFTEEIAKKCKSISAIEIDRDLKILPIID